MKHKVLTLLLATALLANLVGCAAPSKTAQPDEKSNNEVIADPLSTETTPTEADEDKGSGGEDLGTSGEAGSGNSSGIESGLEQQPRAETLSLVFRLAYSENENEVSSSFDEHLMKELNTLVELAGPVSLELPDNYVDLYTNWRIENHGTSFNQATVAPQATYGFTECNETVYATGTVNLRSGPSTDNDKVGSLNGGENVTRTGIGTGTADGWSRIQTADGKTVYVSSNYLSTANPAPAKQNTGTTTNKSTTQSTPKNQGASQSQQGSSGSGDSDRMAGGANGITEADLFNPRDALYGGMSEAEIQEALRESVADTQFRIDGT